MTLEKLKIFVYPKLFIIVQKSFNARILYVLATYFEDWVIQKRQRHGEVKALCSVYVCHAYHMTLNDCNSSLTPLVIIFLSCPIQGPSPKP